MNSHQHQLCSFFDLDVILGAAEGELYDCVAIWNVIGTDIDKYWHMLTNIDKYWHILMNIYKYRQILTHIDKYRHI